jgi:hypothetical protein
MSHSISCACGALTVEVNEGVDCAFSAICHCANCREVTGTASFWANAFPTPEVKITGEAISYQHAVNLRCSCAKCGSFMYEHVPAMGLTMLPAARLTDPAPPMCHVWTKSAVYALPEDGKPRFDEMPPMG